MNSPRNVMLSHLRYNMTIVESHRAGAGGLDAVPVGRSPSSRHRSPCVAPSVAMCRTIVASPPATKTTTTQPSIATTNNIAHIQPIAHDTSSNSVAPPQPHKNPMNTMPISGSDRLYPSRTLPRFGFQSARPTNRLPTVN